MVPGIDGLETYRRVLEINPKQKAILVSGFSETERVREAQQLGAGPYVKKPYMMEKIGVTIRERSWREHSLFTPAIIYVKVIIPEKAGIHNEFGWMPDQSLPRTGSGVRHDILSVWLQE